MTEDVWPKEIWVVRREETGHKDSFTVCLTEEGAQGVCQGLNDLDYTWASYRKYVFGDEP